MNVYNVTDYTEVQFGNLKGYKSVGKSADYFFKYHGDVILVSFMETKNTDNLVKEVVKNISI